MYSFKSLSGGGSLSEALNDYSNSLGASPPYDSNNDCVKRGYSDAQDNKESPYNKEGKSWTTF